MLGKLASMFVEIEGGTPPPQQQAEQAQTQAPAAAPTPAPAAQPTTPHPVPVVPASVDESMVEFLAQAVEEANLPGFDYIEFRNALAQMASAQLPEQQKFIAVFATASTMGLTKEKLFEAINHYQGVLDSKKQEFQAHVEHMTQQDIVAREERKAAIEAKILLRAKNARLQSRLRFNPLLSRFKKLSKRLPKSIKRRWRSRMRSTKSV